MNQKIIILAVLTLAMITFIGPAEARIHAASQQIRDRPAIDVAAIPAYPFETTAKTTRRHGRNGAQRAAHVQTASLSVKIDPAAPEPSYAAPPMGSQIPDEITSYADGLAYSPPEDEVAAARAYLIETAHTGGTMFRVGRDLYLAKLKGYVGTVNIFGVFKTALEVGTIDQVGREQSIAALNPHFAMMAAAAIKTARSHGMVVGLFSAYRPVGYGVGGFSNRYKSCHTYGLAGDFYGVGSNYAEWKKDAMEAGLFRPYATSGEMNHWQAIPDKDCEELRRTVTAAGPKDLHVMWASADHMIDRAKDQTKTVERHHRHYRIAGR